MDTARVSSIDSSQTQIAQQQPGVSPTTGASAADHAGETITVTPSDADVAHYAAGDIVAIAEVIIWPLTLLVVAIAFRRDIGTFFTRALSRLKAVSVGGLSFELSEQSAQPILGRDAAVDIRHAGTENNVNDSTLRSFYAQIASRTPLEFAVVDLGQGNEWLTSRLYILSVILKRMRGLRAVVFVNTLNSIRGHYVGVCKSDAIRWRLAQSYGRYEAALAAGELRAWSGTVAPVAPVQANQRIDNDDGRFMNPDAAAELLRGFLAAIQVPLRPDASIDPGPWQELTRTPPISPGESPTFFENAEWLDTALTEKLLEGVLDPIAMPFNEFQLADHAARTRIVFEHRAPWLSLVRADGRFHGLIDRSRMVEALAGTNVP